MTQNMTPSSPEMDFLQTVNRHQSARWLEINVLAIKIQGWWINYYTKILLLPEKTVSVKEGGEKITDEVCIFRDCLPIEEFPSILFELARKEVYEKISTPLGEIDTQFYPQIYEGKCVNKIKVRNEEILYIMNDEFYTRDTKFNYNNINWQCNVLYRFGSSLPQLLSQPNYKKISTRVKTKSKYEFIEEIAQEVFDHTTSSCGIEIYFPIYLTHNVEIKEDVVIFKIKGLENMFEHKISVKYAFQDSGGNKVHIDFVNVDKKDVEKEEIFFVYTSTKSIDNTTLKDLVWCNTKLILDEKIIEKKNVLVRKEKKTSNLRLMIHEIFDKDILTIKNILQKGNKDKFARIIPSVLHLCGFNVEYFDPIEKETGKGGIDVLAFWPNTNKLLLGACAGRDATMDDIVKLSKRAKKITEKVSDTELILTLFTIDEPGPSETRTAAEEGVYICTSKRLEEIISALELGDMENLPTEVERIIKKVDW